MSVELVTLKVPADEIARVITKIQEARKDEQMGASLMAAIGFCTVIQKPDIQLDQIVKAISNISEYIAFYLESLEGVPKEKIN